MGKENLTVFKKIFRPNEPFTQDERSVLRRAAIFTLSTFGDEFNLQEFQQGFDGFLTPQELSASGDFTKSFPEPIGSERHRIDLLSTDYRLFKYCSIRDDVFTVFSQVMDPDKRKPIDKPDGDLEICLDPDPSGISYIHQTLQSLKRQSVQDSKDKFAAEDAKAEYGQVDLEEQQGLHNLFGTETLNRKDTLEVLIEDEPGLNEVEVFIKERQVARHKIELRQAILSESDFVQLPDGQVIPRSTASFIGVKQFYARYVRAVHYYLTHFNNQVGSETQLVGA